MGSQHLYDPAGERAASLRATISDRWGARRLFIWSLASFTGASLLCALSTSLGFLVAAARCRVSRLAACCLTTLAIIARTYPRPVERAKAITLWGATGGLALVAGRSAAAS